ncbi:unnamed protein product [Boreogadus saida]
MSRKKLAWANKEVETFVCILGEEDVVYDVYVAAAAIDIRPTTKGEGGEGASKEVSRWRIGLKVAWDIYTPGLALPLQSGDCYYMRDDLNTTHQHCVLAGDNARFSSTHRVAECSKGTLEYIQSRCTEALANLGVDPESGAHSLLSLLPLALKHCEDIHNEHDVVIVNHVAVSSEGCGAVGTGWCPREARKGKQRTIDPTPISSLPGAQREIDWACSETAVEVEFEWLRQYWFQGQRYTRFCSWWSGPMEQLERDWKLMETMVQRVDVLWGTGGQNEDIASSPSVINARSPPSSTRSPLQKSRRGGGSVSDRQVLLSSPVNPGLAPLVQGARGASLLAELSGCLPLLY